MITDWIIGSTNEMLAAYPVARTQDIDQAEAVLERILPRIPLQLREATSGDGFDMQMNALDIGASGLTYFAVREADKPADEEHPFGHAKIEAVAALAQTGFLAVLSVAIGEAREREIPRDRRGRRAGRIPPVQAV